MKKYVLFLLGFSSFVFLLFSCSKEDSDELSEQEHAELILEMFNAGSIGVEQGMNNQSASATRSSDLPDLRSSYPIKYSGTYTHYDDGNGSIQLTVNLGGVINYNADPYQCLGGFVLINVNEKINHFRVQLTNGREVYLDTNQSVVFTGTFTLQPGCSTFDPAKSNFRIDGMYRCNGIEYDVNLIGFINADGTCDRISGHINGIIISFDF